MIKNSAALLAIAVAVQLSAVAATPAPVDGIQLYKQAKYAQAAQALDAAIRAKSKPADQLPTLYYYLGCCYYQLNQRDHATEIYRYIRNTFPLSQEAKMAGGMLDQLMPTATPVPVTKATRATTASRASTETPSTNDVEAATKLLKALQNSHRERGYQSTPEELAALPESGKFNFRRGDNGHMEVTISINGRPMPCWFDTGAGAFFGMDQLRHAGVDVSKAKQDGYTSGWAGNPVAMYTMPAQVKLGNVTRTIDVKMTDAPNTFALIGQDFVDGYQYEIDDKGGTVTMHKSFNGQNDQQPINSLYDVPCVLKRGDDVIEMQVNSRKCEAFIDTGASSTILHPSTLAQLGIQIPDDADRVRISGVGGSTTCYVCYLDLRVGPIIRPGFRVLVGGSAGNCIGQDFMEGWRFKVDRQKNLMRFFH